MDILLPQSQRYLKGILRPYKPVLLILDGSSEQRAHEGKSIFSEKKIFVTIRSIQRPYTGQITEIALMLPAA